MKKKYIPYSNPNKINTKAPWWAQKKRQLIIKQTSQELLFYQKIKERFPKLRIQPQKTFRVNGRRFFLDFYIPRIGLVVEIDGGYHLKQPLNDAERDALIFEKTGRWTVRYTNAEIDTDCDKVVGDILQVIKYIEEQRQGFKF